MADDIQQVAGVLFDLVVDAPSSIDSCLPHSPFRIHNLCSHFGSNVAHKVRRYIHFFVASELVSDVERLSL